MNARSFSLWKPPAVVFHIVYLLLVFVFYATSFLLPLPPPLKRQGIFLADELTVLLLLALVFFTYRRGSWLVIYARLTLIIVLFTLPLLRLWNTAESTWNVILGLQPWADAVNYYLDANHLIEGGLLSVFSGRRPLYASLLAVLLKLSNQNLQLVLIVFAVLNGLAFFWFSEEVRTQFGPVSAVIALFLSHFFYRPFAGTILTEQFGLPIGLLGLAILVRAIKNSTLWQFGLGVVLMTFALLIRAGTFFILPLLILFGILAFAANRLKSLRVIIILAAAVALPVIANAWLGASTALPSAVPFGNFAETLYGQAKGGLRWTQATIDHPELASMAEPYRSRQLYRLAFEEVINHPLGLVRGALKAWVDFIVPGPLSAFGFLQLGNRIVDFLFQLAAALLFFAGLWLLWTDRKNPVSSFFLVYWLGTFLSIPFLPPIDAGVRPYTATMASILFPVIFVFSQRVFRSAGYELNTHRTLPLAVPFSLAGVFLVLALVGGPVLVNTARPIKMLPAVCGPGLVPLTIKLTHGSYISLVAPDSEHSTRVPIVSISDIHRSFDEFPYGDFASLLRKIRQPALVAVVNDLVSGTGVWVIGPPELRKYEGTVISACAEPIFPGYSVMSIKTFRSP